MCEFQTVGVPVAMMARMLMVLIVSTVLMLAVSYRTVSYVPSIRQMNVESAVLVTVRTRGAKQRKKRRKSREKTGPAAAQ